MSLDLKNYVPAIMYGATVDLKLSASGTDTETCLALDDADSLTTGKIANFTSNSSSTGTRTLFYVLNDHASATGTTVAEFENDSTGDILLLDHDGVTGRSLYITAASTTQTNGVVDISAAALTTGKVIDISDLAAITTGKVIHIDATGTTHTDGILVHIDSAGTSISSTGRIFLSDHTGATTTSGILNEFKSAANDETVVAQITADSLTSGKGIYITLNALTTGTAIGCNNLSAVTTGKGIHIDADQDTQTTGILCHLDSASTKITGAGRIFLSDHTGNGVGTSGIVNEFKSVANDDAVVLQVTADALTTGKGVYISTNALTTGTALDLSNVSAVTTGKGIHVDADQDTQTSGILCHLDSASTKITGAGRIFLSDHTGAGVGTSGIVNEFKSVAADDAVILQFTTDALTTGTVINITADALTTGKGIALACTSSTIAAGELIDVDLTSAADTMTAKTGAVASIETSRTEQRTSGSTSDDFDLVSVKRTNVMNGAGGTLNAAGSVLRVENVATQSAGTLADTVAGIEMVMDADGTGTGLSIDYNATTGKAIYIDAESTTQTNGVIDIACTVLTTGTVIDISDLAAITQGKAIHIDATGTTQTSGILVHLDSASTGITGAGRIFLSDHTGNGVGTSGIVNEFKSVANDDAIVLQLTADALTTGTALFLTADALTSGAGVSVNSSSTGLTTGGNVLYVGAAGDFNDAGGQVVEIESVHTTGTGVQLTMDAITDGIGAYGTFDALTTGKGLQLASTSSAVAAGELVDVDLTVSADTMTAKTGAVVSFESSRTENRTSGTTADDYDLLSLKRTSVNVDSGGTFTAAGAVLKIENVATQTAGTLTDTVKGIELVTDVDGTGDGMFIDYNSITGYALRIDAESTTQTNGIIDIAPTVMTTGTVIDIGDVDAITTGKGINIQGAGEALTSGIYLDVGHTGSGAHSDVTGNIAKFASSITDTDTSGTATENYDVVLISRTDIMNGTGGTLDADGACLKIESTATQTAGTLTQDVSAIEIATNSYSSSNVYAIKITHNNASSGSPGGIDLSSFSAGEPSINFVDGNASSIDPSATAESGWINIAVGGTVKYVPYYNAS